MFKKLLNFSNYIIDENGNVFNINGKQLSPYVNNKGYKMIDLINDTGTRSRFLVHRLVAILFVPNPENYPIVLHLDNNKLNTNYTNLKWGTYSENNAQAIKDGLNKIPRPDNRVYYQLYNDNEIITCNGLKEIIELNGYGNDSMFRNYIFRNTSITNGKYKGYKITNKIRPIIFDDNDKNKYTFNDQRITSS